MKTIENALDEALKNFDYDTTIKTMKFLNWKWAKINRVPNEKEIKSCIKDLFYSAINAGFQYNEDVYVASSGGFEVRVWRYEDGNKENQIGFSIKFVIIEEEGYTE